MSAPILTLLLALFPPAEQATNYTKPDLLMEPAALAKLVEQVKAMVILDARPKKDYDAGHVPGAYWVDAESWAKMFAKSQKPLIWEVMLFEAGVRENAPIVIYDNAKSKDAARVWWILRYWSFDKARLLNGGWKGWEDGKYPTSKDVPKLAEIKLSLAADAGVFATKGDVLENIKTKKAQLIDARSEGEYCGDVKFAKKGGAIPGAMHLEWSDAIDSKTQRFKSADDLAKLLKDKGIDLNQPIITHCQSGGRAAVMAFTLELMGAKKVSNYYKGWSEWGNLEDTPIVTPKKK